MSLTNYDQSGGIATITMADGKVNALSPEMLAEIGARLDEAEQDAEADVVILTGSATTFSAGFDLRTDAERWPEMLIAGARTAERLLSYPKPTVAACNGNALAMGGFLLLSCDLRIGAAGDFKIGLNEVRIGLTLPYFGIAIARHRLARPWYDRCTVTGLHIGPEEAQAAGFLDQVVPAAELAEIARTEARELTQVKQPAHSLTKVRIREAAIAGIRDGIDRIENREQADW
jgi:enoyl-CoA hydratase